MKYIKKYLMLFLIFLAGPLFLASNFGDGCFICTLTLGHLRDFYIYDDPFMKDRAVYLGVTSSGHFIKMDYNCSTFSDTLLYPQGLNAIDGFQFPYKEVIAAGNSGKILVSNYDTINNWRNVNSGTNSNLNDVALCPDLLGSIYIVGDNGTILKSTDRGNTFLSLNSETTLDLNEVQIINCNYPNNDVIRIAGDSMLTLYSTNSGANWTQQFVTIPSDNNFPLRVDLQAIYFINTDTGWIAGNNYIFKTTNHGLQWITRFKQSQSYNNYSNSMYFYNKDSGIVVGNRGDIQYTTNGGINWFYNSNTQNMTTKNLNKFVFNFGIAAASGDSGIIIYTDSITLGFSSGGRNVPGEFKLYQNYPNPFNPVTKIKFEIPGSVSYSDFKAEIRIFDLLGKEVISVNEQLKPGIYEFEWDASNYSSGVYFYQLTVTAEQVSRLTDTKKMVLIK